MLRSHRDRRSRHTSADKAKKLLLKEPIAHGYRVEPRWLRSQFSWDCELSRSSELDIRSWKALELRTILRGRADVGFDAFLPAAMYE